MEWRGVSKVGIIRVRFHVGRLLTIFAPGQITSSIGRAPSNVQDRSPHESFNMKGSQISALQLKGWFKSKTSIQELYIIVSVVGIYNPYPTRLSLHLNNKIGRIRVRFHVGRLLTIFAPNQITSSIGQAPPNVQDCWALPSSEFNLKGSQISALRLKSWFKSKTSIQELYIIVSVVGIYKPYPTRLPLHLNNKITSSFGQVLPLPHLLHYPIIFSRFD